MEWFIGIGFLSSLRRSPYDVYGGLFLWMGIVCMWSGDEEG